MTNPFAKRLDRKTPMSNKKKLAILFALLLSGGIVANYLSLGDCGYMTVNQTDKMLTIYTSCAVQVTVAEPPAIAIKGDVVYLTIPENWNWRAVPP